MYVYKTSTWWDKLDELPTSTGMKAEVLHLREWQDQRRPRTSRWYSSPVNPQKIETSATPKFGKTSNSCQRTNFSRFYKGGGHLALNWDTCNSIKILVIRTCWEKKLPFLRITQTSVPNETHSFLSRYEYHVWWFSMMLTWWKRPWWEQRTDMRLWSLCPETPPGCNRWHNLQG